MDAASVDRAGFDRRLVVRWSLALLLVYGLVMVVCTVTGRWLGDADFVNVWAAGRLALQGQAAAAYDWGIHRQMEVAVLGHDFSGYYGWHYPPMLLFAAAPLAALPYGAAWLVWGGLTAALLAWALWRVIPEPAVVLPMMAAPTTLFCASVGQNGFLTAALMAASLAFLERRPLLAGLFLGMLTYKPHFGLLFPLALLAGGHWRALLGATLSGLALAGASALVFGVDTWLAFLASAGNTMAVLRNGAPGWHKLQSVYALLHPLGDAWAWGGQIAAMLLLAGLVAWAFRKPLPHSLRAALLVASSAAAAPYAYVYDLTVIAVAAAFLARDGLVRGHGPWDRRILVLAVLGPALFEYLGSGTALVSTALLIGLSLWRALRQQCEGAVEQGVHVDEAQHIQRGQGGRGSQQQQEGGGSNAA